MTEEPESFTHAYFRRIDAKLDRILDELGSHGRRITNLENGLAHLEAGTAQVSLRVAEVSARLDRTNERLDRIETRLGLIDPALPK